MPSCVGSSNLSEAGWSTSRRATAAQPTLQFFRNRIPHGTSQKGVGDTLNINERTVRRHLKPVRRVQQIHKIPYDQAWAYLKISGEAGEKPTCFLRGNEAFKYGCNTYDLNDFADLKSFADFESKIKEIKKIYTTYRRRERLGN